MANTYVVNLAIPAGVGVGAGSVTSAMGRTKSVTVTGTFNGGALLLEASNDGGVTWGQIPNSTFTGAGCRALDVAAQQMRVRVLAAGITGASVDVGASSEGGLFASVPAPAANAAGATLDVTTFGAFMTFIVTGTFTGTLTIEVSEDGVDFVPCMTFTAPGLQSTSRIANLVRARSQGAIGAIAPVISVGAINDSDALIDAAIAQPRTTFVFRPGGVAAENVYVTWPALMTAIGLVEGDKTILFDDSIVTPCTIPAGGPYDMTDVEWLALPLGGVATEVLVATGATFTGLRRFRGNMNVTNDGAPSPVTDFANNDVVMMSEGVAVRGDPAAAFFAAGGGLTVFFKLWDATLGGNGEVAANWNLARTLELELYSNGRVAANALAGIVGSTIRPNYMAASGFVDPNQAGVLGTYTTVVSTADRWRVRDIVVGAATANFGDLMRADPSGGAFTITLPTGDRTSIGQRVCVKNVTASANVITIDGAGAQTIDGAATTTIAAGFGSVTLVFDGTSNWMII